LGIYLERMEEGKEGEAGSSMVLQVAAGLCNHSKTRAVLKPNLLHIDYYRFPLSKTLITHPKTCRCYNYGPFIK
jgi:hypothetical protein